MCGQLIKFGNFVLNCALNFIDSVIKGQEVHLPSLNFLDLFVVLHYVQQPGSYSDG